MVRDLTPSELRRYLVKNEPEIKDGYIDPPQKPGPGIDPDCGIMERFALKTN